MDTLAQAKHVAEKRASEAEAMLAAKREMAAERIKKETDGAAGFGHSLTPQSYTSSIRSIGPFIWSIH